MHVVQYSMGHGSPVGNALLIVLARFPPVHTTPTPHTRLTTVDTHEDTRRSDHEDSRVSGCAGWRGHVHAARDLARLAPGSARVASPRARRSIFIHASLSSSASPLIPNPHHGPSPSPPSPSPAPIPGIVRDAEAVGDEVARHVARGKRPGAVALAHKALARRRCHGRRHPSSTWVEAPADIF